MIALTAFYDDYIDQPEIIEQKNRIEYIVRPPQKGVQNNEFFSLLLGTRNFFKNILKLGGWQNQFTIAICQNFILPFFQSI